MQHNHQTRPSIIEPETYTIAQIARILGIGKTQAWELVRTPPEQGGIPSFYIGPKTLRVWRSDFEQWKQGRGGAADGGGALDHW